MSSKKTSTKPSPMSMVEPLEIPKYKVVFLGDESSGKTSIIQRAIDDTYTKEYEPTLGVDLFTKTMSVTVKDDGDEFDGGGGGGGEHGAAGAGAGAGETTNSIRLQIWDTSGQERFRSSIPSYVRDCHVAIVPFDITDRKQFDSIDKWMDEIQKIRGGGGGESDGAGGDAGGSDGKNNSKNNSSNSKNNGNDGNDGNEKQKTGLGGGGGASNNNNNSSNHNPRTTPKIRRMDSLSNIGGGDLFWIWLVGTKVDRKLFNVPKGSDQEKNFIPYEEIENKIATLQQKTQAKINFFETSAKAGYNVRKLFFDMSTKLIDFH